MFFKTSGIVLHSIKYSDTSLVATIYTQSHGRQSFLIQGVYRKKSGFSPTLFQPLTLLDLEISVTPKRELQRIKEVSVSNPFHSLPYDHTKSAIALFLSEILYKTLREEETNQAMFGYLFHSIQLLDAMEYGTANFHLWFIVHLTKYLGFFPVDNYSTENCMFDAANGRFYEPLMIKPSENDLIIARLLHDILNTIPENLRNINLNHHTRNLLLKHVVEFYHFHLGGLGTIKSMPVLKQVFDN